MPMIVADLVAELKTLRKGRGVLGSRIGEQVGPLLREICHIAPADSAAAIRAKVNALLCSLAEALAADQCDAVLAAFAMHPDVKHPFLQERVTWVARRLERDERTARRRIDEAIEAIADLAAAQYATPLSRRAPEPAWHTERLYALLALDLPQPEVFVTRRIVADQNGVDDLDLAMTLTSSQPRIEPLAFDELQIDVFRGGTLAWKPNEAVDRFAFSLALARPLERGEAHEVVLRFRVPPGRSMHPHYVCVPQNRCDSFELSIHFGKKAAGRQVWLLSDVFQRDIEDPLPQHQQVPVDSAGDVRVEFSDLKPGKAYGLRWSEAGMPVPGHAGATLAMADGLAPDILHVTDTHS